MTAPAAFPVNPAVTEAVTSGELELGPAVAGVRRGTVTVRTAYLRGAKPASLTLGFYG